MAAAAVKEKRQTSDTYRVGLLLALAGGYLDAYTFICRGGVFANAQTGNIVLLGVSLANGKFAEAGHYFVPIFAFFFGILLAELIKSALRSSRPIHWRQIIIATETLALIYVAFLPLGGSADVKANIIVSFVCSLQVEAFRKMHGSAYATTMCTGNLRSAAETLYNYKQTGDRELFDRSMRYFGIIGAFIVGAASGAVITDIFSAKSVLLPALILFAVFVLMFREEL